jgi:peptidylprolyl isomerase
MKRIFLSLSLILCGLLVTQAQNTEVTFYTNHGDFVVEMYDTTTPITSGNFVDLVQQKFYDSVIFHRVINNFMIQGGDPTGTGTGGPGYTIQDEFVTGVSNIQKSISMANTGAPNSGGSQFFINLVDNTYLDFDKTPLTSKHPPFGFTISGFTVVQAIGGVAVDGSNRPISDVVMDSLRVTAIGPLVGIRSNRSEIGMAVYPNPVRPQSIIQVNTEGHKTLNFSVVDPLGRVVAIGDLNPNGKETRVLLSDLIQTELTPGIYNLTLFSETGQGTTSFVLH